MKIFNFFKKKVEIEDEVQPEVETEETVIKPDGLYRITYGSFYTWSSTTENFKTSAVWDYQDKDCKSYPPNSDKTIGIIDTDDTYCIDPDTGKQFFIFTPIRELEYKSIRAFDIKDILIELDRQKSVIEEKTIKRFRDKRVQFLKDMNSKVEVDLCNKSMNDE